jgi:putative ABC transport system permease protein
MGTLMQDLRYAFRLLLKSPGFTAVALLTLALGIGANTALFTVVNSVLLRPLNYPKPEELVQLRLGLLPDGSRGTRFSLARFNNLREQNRTFSSVAAICYEGMMYLDKGTPSEIGAGRVSANFFEVLGVTTNMGRTFTAEEETPGSNPVAVVGHDFWKSTLGSDPQIIGKTISLNGIGYSVIGVLQRPLDAPIGDSDVWVPRISEFSQITKEAIANGSGYLNGVARLRPGMTLKQAQVEMNSLSETYRKANAGMVDSNPNATVWLESASDSVVSDIRTPLLLLLGAVGFVLLITCANIANLLLVRGNARARETAIRAALGASPSRIVRLFLTESLLISFFGTALGVLVASWSIGPLLHVVPVYIPRLDEVQLDQKVFLFAFGVAVITGLLFGLAPALKSRKPNLVESLKEAGRGNAGPARREVLRGGLVVSQIALSLVLLAGTGLLLQTFSHLANVSLGYQPENLLVTNVPLSPVKYSTPPQLTTFFNELRERAAALPGAKSVSVARFLPMNGNAYGPFQIEGRPPVAIGQRPFAAWNFVSPGYFETLEIPLVRGRTFTEGDNADSQFVVILSQSFVRKYFPNEDPIGKLISVGRLPKPSQVIGVVGDVKNVGLSEEPYTSYYSPLAQRPFPSMRLVIRTSGDPLQLTSAVREMIHSMDKELPRTSVWTIQQSLKGALTLPRATTILLAAFAAVAMILACIGLYGVIAYSVNRRTREIGIRLALGAQPKDVLRLIVGEGTRLALAGVVVGILAALGLTRLISKLLYGVSATDPLTFGGVAAVLLVVALAACYFPARRAMRVDPVVALRNE